MPSHRHLCQTCDTLSTMLESGVPVRRTLRVAARQAGSRSLRRALSDAADRVERGDSLSEALGAQNTFPPLFLHLVEAGEASGHLERVFGELRDYHEFQRQMWSTFFSRLLMPALQYVAAVFVLSLARYIIGMFSDAGGTAMAIRTAVFGYGIPLALVGLYFLLTRALSGARVVHEILLKVPLVNRIVRSLALARFSLVMHMMLNAGITVDEAIDRAARATANGAFVARSTIIGEAIRNGAGLTEALEKTGLFPRDYREVLEVGEEGGKTAEKFEWLSNEHQKRSQRYISAAVTTLGYVIWGVVALFIIYFIFQFFTRYIGQMQRMTAVLSHLSRESRGGFVNR